MVPSPRTLGALPSSGGGRCPLLGEVQCPLGQLLDLGVEFDELVLPHLRNQNQQPTSHLLRSHLPQTGIPDPEARVPSAGRGSEKPIWPFWSIPPGSSLRGEGAAPCSGASHRKLPVSPPQGTDPGTSQPQPAGWDCPPEARVATPGSRECPKGAHFQWTRHREWCTVDNEGVVFGAEEACVSLEQALPWLGTLPEVFLSPASHVGGGRRSPLAARYGATPARRGA